jgi:hypothetical protein
VPEHRAHAILVPLFNTEQSLLERMATFTRVIAAFLSASGAVAINLGGAHATHEATFFVDIASIEEPLPAMLMIWNGISVAKDGDRVSLLSLGMAQLDLPDLLLTAPATAVNVSARVHVRLARVRRFARGAVARRRHDRRKSG